MEIESFRNGIQKLQINYKVEYDKNTLNEWWKDFKEVSTNKFLEAIEGFIAENKFKPTKQELEERIFNNSSWNNINFNSSYWYKNLRDYCDRDEISYYDITKGITFKLAPYKDGGK